MALSKEDTSKINFSFAGCGFLGMYHFGVIACLKRHVPHLLKTVSGASAGALATCCAVADVPISDAVAMWIEGSVTTRDKVIGAFSPSSDVAGIVRFHLEKCVPPDGHLRVNGKVHISLTRVPDMQNVVISHFNSRAELIDALICAVTIPFFVGLIPPLFRGERYIDGGFSNNQIIQNEYTVTVSPYAGGTGICPLDGPLSPWIMDTKNTPIELSSKNFVRIAQSLIPPRPDSMAQICHNGYTDALRFLVERGLVGCSACIPSPAEVSRALTENRIGNKDDEDGSTSEAEVDQEMARVCRDCDTIREFSKPALPESVQKTLREAIDDDMSTLRAKLRQYKIMKLASIAAMPLALYYDIFVATRQKLVQVPQLLSPTLAFSKLISLTPIQDALLSLT